MLYWTPDFCPSGSCHLEIEPDWSAVVSFVRCCPFHQSLRDSGLTDQQTFIAMLQSSRIKEYARYAAKIELALDKEHPGISYSVDAQGNFVIVTGASGAKLTKIRTAVANALAGVDKPVGTATIVVN